MAVITLAAIWLVVFVAHGGGDPGWTPANSVQVGILGIVAYPLAWYLLIYRKRDYSARRTWFLVAATYAAVSSFVIVLIFVGMLYPALQWVGIAISSPKLESLWLIAGALIARFIAAIFALIVVGFIGIAYVVTATPIAFLHRFALIRLFAGKRGARNMQVSKT